jgi:hypothetical protein
MKKTCFHLALALAAPLALASDARIGEPAPAFTLTDWNGKTRSLADFAGKTVVLEWTNHECPFVVKHYGGKNMQRQQADATGNDVVWLVVNSSAPGKQGHVSPEKAREVQGNWEAKQANYLFDTAGDTGQRLRRQDHAAHVHHRWRRRPALQRRDRLHPQRQPGGHPEGGAVRRDRAGRTRGWQAGQPAADPALRLQRQVLRPGAGPGAPAPGPTHSFRPQTASSAAWSAAPSITGFPAACAA